jgi:hypothetical protein
MTVYPPGSRPGVSSLAEIAAKSYTMRCPGVFVTAVEPMNGSHYARGFFEYLLGLLHASNLGRNSGYWKTAFCR